MESDDEWKVCTDKKKIKRQQRKNNRELWNNLLSTHPHIVTPERAHRLESKLNIDGLSNFLMSSDCIEFQRSGWKYVKVLKPSHNISLVIPPKYDDIDVNSFCTLDIGNGWGDKIIFIKLDALNKDSL